MSYAIIKSIKVIDGKVFINSTSNNVYPHTFMEWECSSLTKILKEQGREALDVEILGEYENGNFQRGDNRYTRALQVLRHMEEYKLYDYRVISGRNTRQTKKEGSRRRTGTCWQRP